MNSLNNNNSSNSDFVDSRLFIVIGVCVLVLAALAMMLNRYSVQKEDKHSKIVVEQQQKASIAKEKPVFEKKLQQQKEEP